MKVKYIGESFGAVSLTNGKIYECLGFDNGMLRVIDDSEEDYPPNMKRRRCSGR